MITYNLIEWAQQSGACFDSHYFNCWFEVFADVRSKGVMPLQDDTLEMTVAANIVNAWSLEREERGLALHVAVRQDSMANPRRMKEYHPRETINGHWNKKIINWCHEGSFNRQFLIAHHYNV